MLLTRLSEPLSNRACRKANAEKAAKKVEEEKKAAVKHV